jgi:hypothetical protein
MDSTGSSDNDNNNNTSSSDVIKMSSYAATIKAKAQAIVIANNNISGIKEKVENQTKNNEFSIIKHVLKLLKEIISLIILYLARSVYTSLD